MTALIDLRVSLVFIAMSVQAFVHDALIFEVLQNSIREITQF